MTISAPLSVPAPVPTPEPSAYVAPSARPKTSPILAWFRMLWWTIMTVLHSGWVFVPWIRPRWFLKDMGDQRGRVIVITGANSGTGYATASAYYNRGATVFILCRSATRASKAMDDLKRGGVANILSEMVYSPQAKTEGRLEYVPCDLADLASVDAAAREIERRTERVDVLFANAGVMALPEGERTKQGYPIQFGINVLGHQRLISLLLPLLQSTSRSTGHPTRLISLSSNAHMSAPPGGVDYSSLERNAPHLEKFVEYGESKWANVALAKYVHAHYGPGASSSSSAAASGSNAGAEVIAIAVHPGVVATNLFMHNPVMHFLAHNLWWALACVTTTSSTGALNQIWAAECPDQEGRELSGGYVWCFQTRGQERADLHDPLAWERLWAWCEAQGKRAE